jgi:uncharacterized surface anchored protein
MTTRSTLVVLALLITVAACGDYGATGPTNRAESDIIATVTADGSPLAGVTVELFAEAGTTVLETAATGSAGDVAFVDLVAGTYDVEITVPSGYSMADGEPVRQTVTVDRNATARVTFALVS